MDDIDPQKVHTIQSWMARGNSSFVNAKLADHILARARATVKTAVCENLEEPDKHLQNYGDVYCPISPVPHPVDFTSVYY